MNYIQNKLTTISCGNSMRCSSTSYLVLLYSFIKKQPSLDNCKKKSRVGACHKICRGDIHTQFALCTENHNCMYTVSKHFKYEIVPSHHMHACMSIQLMDDQTKWFKLLMSYTETLLPYVLKCKNVKTLHYTFPIVATLWKKQYGPTYLYYNYHNKITAAMHDFKQ